jgi:hypothetical protein
VKILLWDCSRPYGLVWRRRRIHHLLYTILSRRLFFVFLPLVFFYLFVSSHDENKNINDQLISITTQCRKSFGWIITLKS